MPKLLIGIVLCVIGVAGCFGAPALLVWNMLPEPVTTVQRSGPTEFDAAEVAGYFLVIDTGLPMGAPPPPSKKGLLPDGDYGFRSSNGDLQPIVRNSEFNGGEAGLGYEIIGMTRLQPGHYTVVAPEMPEGLQLAVRRSKLAGQEDNLEKSGMGMLVAMGAGGLFGLVGVVLMILGIIQLVRGKPRGDD